MLANQAYCILLLLTIPASVLSAKQDRFYTCKYELTRDQVSREEATVRCEKRGGKLAVIHSAVQNEEVRGLLESAQLQSAWIGLFLTDHIQQWDDGTKLGFSKLEPLVQGPASGANVLVDISGGWSLMKRKHKAGYVCSVRRQYILYPQPLTRSSSTAACSHDNMVLARVAGSNDARQVRKLIRSEGGLKRHHWFWVGGENPTATGVWQWSDGTPAVGLNVDKTAVGESGPLYVAINKRSGRLRPLHDYFLNPFICQCPNFQKSRTEAQLDYGEINSEGEYVPLFKSFAETRLRIINPEHDHEDEVEKMRKMRYSYHRTRVTHGAAQSYCRSQGGDLGCPRSQLQQTRILDTIRSNSWLGLVDVDEEGVWRCVGDESLPTYTNWYQGFGRGAVPEPDNMTDRRKPGAGYVQILHDPDRSWRHGRWIDRGAPQYEYAIRSPFVCEYPR